ncbi:septum formation initiator family protein [Mycolicibacterium moriokaense]|nr:septum formation initiator family protein [Mycolicibacterium moriokaense]
MPEAKRPDPKRRSPASRPAKTSKSGKSGGSARGRPQSGSAARREPRKAVPRPQPPPDEQLDEPAPVDSIRRSIAEAAEQQSEQRLGSAARRAAILAAVVCVLTLTIAGPVRTYFAQRTEMKQLAASEDRLRTEIADLEEQKAKLADPVYIAAQARERLGFVKPGDIPYQVQLPPGAIPPSSDPVQDVKKARAGQPWYTSLWHTIADDPHNVAPTAPPVAPGAPVPPAVPVPPPGG